MKKLFSNELNSNQITILVSVLLLGILVLGAFMRFWHLGYSSFWIDEGFTLMQARGIAIHGYPLLDSEVTEWKDVLIPYIIAPIVKFFSFENEWLLRLPSSIFGVLTIFVGHHLAAILFSRQTGLFFSFFLAFCHWYIAWSQQVRGYAAAIFFVLLFFYFLKKYDRTSRYKYLYILFATIFFGVLAKKIVIVLVVPMLLYLFLKKKFLIFGLTMIVCAGMFAYSILGYWHSFTFNPLNYFIYYLKDYLWSYFMIFIICGFLGFFAAIVERKKDQIIHLAIISFMVTSIVVVALFIFVSEKRYLLLITPFLFLYTAYFISWIGSYFKKRYIVSSVAFMLVVMFGVYFNNGIILLPQPHYALEHYTPQPNYTKAYSFIRQNGFNEADHIISANPVMDIVYLGRSDYFIPWSLTGRDDSVNLIGDREYYTNTRKLYGKGQSSGLDKIQSLQKSGNVYVVFDSLAQRRMQFDIWDDITEEGEQVFSDGNIDRVFVYYFPKNEILFDAE